VVFITLDNGKQIKHVIMSPMHFGAHISVAGGLHRAFERGAAVGCSTMQIFSKNERQWKGKPLTDEAITAFKAEQARTGIGPIVVHDSYLINLASPNEDLWEKSKAAFADELERCQKLDIPYLVTHPGAHTGGGVEGGVQREAEALNHLFANGVGGDTMVLLETTAGQGTCLGGCFEELARLLELIEAAERVGICVDTCHIFAAGYDIRAEHDYTAVMDHLVGLVGLDRIKLFHLNDSKGTLGSHLDRHAAIGEGQIGLDGFRWLVNDPRFCQLPMIIETPKSDDGSEDIRNLTTLRNLRQH
jgi:deoxyribonuclease-4